MSQNTLDPISHETLLAGLNWRYATKKFDPTRAIPQAEWAALEQSLVLSPSSFGLQPWKFLVVTDRAIREKLVEFSWGQRQPADCSHLVVFAVREDLSVEDIDRYIARIAEVRGATRESLASFRDVMVGFRDRMAGAGQLNAWATRQVYIALGTLMTGAALLGIDTCPMEGFDPAAYNRLLGLEGTGYSAVVLCPAGYRAPDDRYSQIPKVRFKPEDLIRRMP